MPEINGLYGWVIVFFKDGKQITKGENFIVSRQPPLNITCYMESEDKVHYENIGGDWEVSLFNEIPDFDEVWVGRYSPLRKGMRDFNRKDVSDPEPVLQEEWELTKARPMPLFGQLITDHTGEFPDNSECWSSLFGDGKTIRIVYGNMRFRNHFPLPPIGGGEPKTGWTNWSTP
jgi:hypothetical protein